MSLLDDENYGCRLFLKQVWDEMTGFYEALSPKAQLAVHQYYRPSENLSRDQLLEHWWQVTQDRPDLEGAAQQAYQRVQAAYEQNRQIEARPEPARAQPARKASGARRKRQRSNERQLRVRGAPRVEPALQLLADALIDLAMDMHDEGMASPGGEDSDRS